MIAREELIEKAAKRLSERAAIALWAGNEYIAWDDKSDMAKDAYRQDASLIIRIALEAAAEAVNAQRFVFASSVTPYPRRSARAHRRHVR